MKARILVVDDNAELAENVCEILEGIDGFDVECHTASDRSTAMAACGAANHDLDLALVDLRLPDGDGLGLVADLREGCRFVEVVIITGDATLESAISAVEQGAFAYVLKPFRPAELLRTAHSALDKVRAVRELEQARAGLELSERRHRELVEAVPAFVLSLDAEGRIALWNDQLERVTGFRRAEMLGKPGRDLVADGDRRLPLKKGGHRMVRWKCAAVSGPDQQPVTYALGTDVTEERDMLTRTLRAERLAAVGTLAAGLAHEVRNPLNSATLQLQVLRRRIDRGQCEPAQLLPVVDVVDSEIRRLARLVTEFLEFARPQPLELRPVDLNRLLKDLTELVRPESNQAGIELVTQLDDEVGPVQADPERLRQVFLNLVRNAIEAMAPSGAGVLSLKTHRPDSEGNVTVIVEDTGPGFPDDAPVFDAFYTTKESGTGLGLSIVHRLVSTHEGTIGIETRPGRTCFTIHLPAMGQTDAGP